jgi:single-stranded DNA-binding protein
MSININVVVQSGIVKWPALRYGTDGKPEFRFVLYRETQNAEGQTFPLSIPCCAVSGTAERLATELDEGDFVVVTQGELVYRKRDTKDGEKSRLEILVWRVQKGEPGLGGASVVMDAPADPSDEPPEPSDEPPARTEQKKGKPHYPKWKPESTGSVN